MEAQLLAAHLLRVDRTWVVSHPEAEINELAAEHLLHRRELAEPLAYILGVREFFGRTFIVKRGVLIPRHETEMLVEFAPRHVVGSNPRVLDVGTGSGCIAISLKLENPAWCVTGLDKSEAALEVAKENGRRLNADVEWIHSDLFAELVGPPFDLIVSNPPYVERDAELSLEVRDWEPTEALFAEGDTFGVYRRLASEGPDVLAKQGTLLTEIGAGQANTVREIFESAGWMQTALYRDLAGIERVIAFRPKKRRGL